MAKPDHMRVGDFAPVIRREVLRGGSVVPLPDGTLVTLRARRDGESLVQTFVGEVEDAAAGLVRYPWAEGEPIADAEESVTFWVTFEVEVPDVGRITIPTIGEDALVVHPRGP